jgi:adenylate kinase
MVEKGLAIVLLGAPGAGKGTQARMLSESLKLPHISTGDMLREAMKNQTELGKKVQGYMDSGALVPNELVDAIIAERIGSEDCSRGFILDGYPRTIQQAQVLQPLLDKNAKEVLTLGVEVSDCILIKRLSARWTCPKCGKMFNAQLDPDKINGRCDKCDANLVQRKDDTEEVIAKRLQVYHKETRQLIRHYRDQGVYIKIDGNLPIGEVFDNIVNLITNYELRIKSNN